MRSVINPVAQLLRELKTLNGTQKIAIKNIPTKEFCVKLPLRDAINKTLNTRTVRNAVTTAAVEAAGAAEQINTYNITHVRLKRHFVSVCVLVCVMHAIVTVRLYVLQHQQR